ncbi:CopG family transcriptional regulator [Methylorubrum populi]
MSETGKNKGGRPRVDATPVTVRVPPAQLAPLDAWIAAQPDPKPSRPEAIRKLLDGALAEGVSHFPFEIPHIPFSTLGPGELTPAGLKAALNEWVVQVAGQDEDLQRVVRSTVAMILIGEGYGREALEAVKVQSPA